MNKQKIELFKKELIELYKKHELVLTTGDKHWIPIFIKPFESVGNIEDWINALDFTEAH